MHVTQWKEPALNWNGAVAEEGRASILEIRSDQFIPDFLEAMGSNDPAAYFQQHRIDDKGSAADPLRLFQPLHGCFYLVTASLVCRQLGLPDKAIDRPGGESVFYVIRRRTGDGEQAWIPDESGGHWQTLSGSVLRLAEGEERLPLHPVKICPRPETPHSALTDNVERDLYYGYIPTGNRDKYKDSYRRTLAQSAAAATLVDDFVAAAEKEYSAEGYSFREEMFLRRVYLPWQERLDQQPSFAAPFVLPVEAGSSAQEEQLYLLLELGNFLKNNLPTLWQALEAGSGATLSGQMAQLYDLLSANLEVESGGSMRSLRAVLLQYEGNFPLVRGEGSLPGGLDLNLNEFTTAESDNPETNLATLHKRVKQALGEEDAPLQLPEAESAELTRLISEQVQPREPAGGEPLYHIRTVYERRPDDPLCPPVVSTLPSRPFRLTKFFEPDAPARLVRLEAPSIKPRDLRRYARGVGIEMSPELHRLASCLGGGDVQGVIDSVESCENGGLSIQMICSFSIQIIFLVAFIVMFIFLISLNFIFGWLAYLRICLPIPTRSS